MTSILPKLKGDVGGEGSNETPSTKKRPLPSDSDSEEEDFSYDEGGEGSDSLTSKKRSPPRVSEEVTSKKPCVPSISEEDYSSSDEEDSSSAGEEIQNGPTESHERVLSDSDSDDDSDSCEEKSFADLLRSRRPHRLSPRKPLTLPDTDVLDCPNCFQPLTKPIFQCKKGHLACSSCCTQLKNKCSFCALPIGDIRCRVMEKVLKTCLVACSNAKYGCKQSRTYGKEEADHQKLCVFAPCSCPVGSCSYIGYYKDLNNHFRATHQQQCRSDIMSSRSKITSFVFNSPQDFLMGHYDDPVIFQEEKEGHLIVVQSFKGSNGMYVSVNRIAPMVSQVPKLTCSIAYVEEHSTLKLEFLVMNVQKVREQQEQAEDSFMLIPSHMLSRYHLKMHICIGHK